MLVLARKIGERTLAGGVWVTVIEVHGDRVRLGFEAPHDIPILREELVTGEAEPLDLVEV